MAPIAAPIFPPRAAPSTALIAETVILYMEELPSHTFVIHSPVPGSVWLCKKYKARIVVNTDSHFSTAVGNAQDALAVLKDIDFPKELIVNGSEKRFKAYLKECG